MSEKLKECPICGSDGYEHEGGSLIGCSNLDCCFYGDWSTCVAWQSLPRQSEVDALRERANTYRELMLGCDERADDAEARVQELEVELADEIKLHAHARKDRFKLQVRVRELESRQSTQTMDPHCDGCVEFGVCRESPGGEPLGTYPGDGEKYPGRWSCFEPGHGYQPPEPSGDGEAGEAELLKQSAEHWEEAAKLWESASENTDDEHRHCVALAKSEEARANAASHLAFVAGREKS